MTRQKVLLQSSLAILLFHQMQIVFVSYLHCGDVNLVAGLPLIEKVKETQLVARSQMSKAKGKKAVKVRWFAKDGSSIDYLEGFEVFRSYKRYEGYTQNAFFKTERHAYWNTAKMRCMTMEQQVRVWGELYRNTLVCVDSSNEGTLQGWFFHPYLEAGEGFRSLAELFRKLEWIMDEMDFPQATVQLRDFGGVSGASPGVAIPSEPAVAPAGQKQKGVLGTFYVRILFRQNASWQGTVTWAETGQQVSFRSVLELMRLLDSAVSL